LFCYPVFAYPFIMKQSTVVRHAVKTIEFGFDKKLICATILVLTGRVSSSGDCSLFFLPPCRKRVKAPQFILDLWNETWISRPLYPLNPLLGEDKQIQYILNEPRSESLLYSSSTHRSHTFLDHSIQIAVLKHPKSDR
jgi:hypothetical protein